MKTTKFSISCKAGLLTAHKRTLKYFGAKDIRKVGSAVGREKATFKMLIGEELEKTKAYFLKNGVTVKTVK